MKNQLVITNLHVSTKEGKKILNGISLTIKKGEIHAIMGPNGGGKSTLAAALMGHPGYVITEGKIILNETDITSFTPDQKAKEGLFLGFQYPVEIPGVNFGSFLRMAINEKYEASIRHDEFARLAGTHVSTSQKTSQEIVPQVKTDTIKKLSPLAFKNQFVEEAKQLAFSQDITKRFLNEGFSGGEKKKAEILQLAMLKPDFAILDEPDSGLDVDALKFIAQRINTLSFDVGLVLITHYQRILQYIKPDFVHVLIGGKIVTSGNATLAQEIEKEGYQKYQVINDKLQVTS